MSTITVNGTEHIFQFDECPFGEVFADANLGSVTQLELTLIRQRTWESCDNNIMDATMYYRIYQGTTTTQPFIPYSLSMLVQNNVTDYREKIRTNPTPINVLQGLNPNTTYTIELYFTSNVDLDLDLQPDTALVLNNNGGSYKAIFTTDATFNNCSVLYAPAPTQIDVSCYGFSDGAAALSVCGGTEPYTYNWTDGNTEKERDGLAVGTYQATVKDATGCDQTTP
ncbi:MAG: SprB repeat-containing protein, partial [Saprospiraceae bacterium]|nr:SprB repeat-containing protein [Saprospiraceae bacterium]